MDNKTAAGSLRRSIPDDYTYNPKKLKHLKAILHNISIALGTLSSAHNEFSKLKGPEISPDGLLGGVGYIIPIREIKETFNTSLHGLSNVADCIADELTNPRWNSKEDKEVKDLIKEKEEVTDKLEDQGLGEEPPPEGVAPGQSQEDLSPSDVVTVNELDKNTKKASEDQIRKALSPAVIAKLTGNQHKGVRYE